MRVVRLLLLGIAFFPRLIAAFSPVSTLTPTPGQILFSFFLPTEAATSAGVYDLNGLLIRTLWSNQHYPAGSRVANWDGKDDTGNVVAAGTYQIRLFYNNVTYTWGVIGDTSTSWTAPNSWDAQSKLPVDMAIAGGIAYTANAYSEGGKNASSFALAAPQQPTALNSAGYLDEDQYVSTDGINVYFAQVGSGWPASVPYVMAWNVAANGYYVFPSGVVPTDGTKVTSVIDQGNVAAGIAVQTTGNILAVSHAAANQIMLFDKTSGAQLSTISVPSPGRMAYSPAGVLWYISNATVTNGSVTLPGLVAPLTVAIDPATSNVLVADGGSSQQVKTFNAAGVLLSTYGTLGGYTDCSPTVSKTRLWLDNTAGVGYTTQTLLAVAPDSSFWVGDPGNARILHISAAGAYIEEISFLRYLYYVAIDHQNPTRVFADALEYTVDYSRSIQPGDGGNPTWALSRNWAACVPTGYTGQFGFRFSQVQTLPNGLTYAMTSSLTGPYNQLAQLPATGPLRFSGQLLTPTQYVFQFFDHSGNLAYWNFTTINNVAVQVAYSSPLTGYDANNWPTYGPAVTVASVPNTAGTITPNGYSGWGQWFAPIPTTGGYYPTYQTAISTPGQDRHLGAVLAGGKNWSWVAAPGAILAAPDGHGTFTDNQPFGGHGGIAAFSEGRFILQGYDGQWGTYASQWMLWSEAGALIGQFGHGFPTPAPVDGTEYPSAAGNIWTMTTATNGNEIYLYNSDEGYHPGIHQWRISGLDSIHELAGRAPLGGTTMLQ
jgi:hypothetical protein